MSKWIKVGCGHLLVLGFLVASGVGGFLSYVLIQDAAPLSEWAAPAGGAIGAGALALGLLYYLWVHVATRDPSTAGQDTPAPRRFTADEREEEPGKEDVLERYQEELRSDLGIGTYPDRERPWEDREEWSDGRITTGGTGGATSTGNWVRGALLLGIGCFFATFVDLSRDLIENAKWILLFVAPWGLVGVGMLAREGYRALRGRRFGETVFEMGTVPGVLGGPLCGVVHTGVPVDDALDTEFHVAVTCYRRYLETNNSTKRRVLWRGEKTIKGRPSTDGTTLDVPVGFELPSDRPASTPEKETERTMWTVKLSADLSGVDYSAELEVPVFDVEPDPSVSVESYTRRDQRFEPDEPVSDGITLQRSPEDALELAVGWGRRPWDALLCTALALAGVAGSALLLALGELVGYMVALFPLVLSPMAYYLWTYRSWVIVDRGGITVRGGALGFESSTQFPCSELETVRVKHGTAHDTLYLLRAPERDAAKRREASGDEEKDTEQIVAARWLENHLEAEWIAGQIEEVAARQARFE